jgi:pimeloyl-ACP methyl ester carboxylesterase
LFDLIVEPLAKRHMLIIPDLRGCRKSSNAPPPHSVKQQAADLVSSLDHLGITSTDALGYFARRPSG